MKAPSEKHLEDWIVENFGHFATTVLRDYFVRDGMQIVARQFPLPSGRPDLILRNNQNLILVELKKGAIDEDCIAQTIRYIGDLKRLWFEVFMHSEDEHDYFRYADFSLAGGGESEISAIVIGDSIKKDALLFCSYAANISMFTYDFTGAQYDFTSWSINYEFTKPLYEECAYGVLGNAMRAIMRERTLIGQDRRRRLDEIHGEEAER